MVANRQCVRDVEEDERGIVDACPWHKADTVNVKVVEQPPAPAGHSLVGQVFAFEAFDSKQQPLTHFDKPYTLTLHYTDIASVHEDRLQLYYWKDGQWILVPAVVDSGANTLAATLDHMTIFATFTNEMRLYMLVVQW